MADFHGQVPEHILQEVSFSTYSADDVRKISVLEITNSQTFDALGHPTKGGLYDSKLGSTEKEEACGSCKQSSARCVGHMGHIDLPLPIFNPIFMHLAYQLLKGTCFSCRRFRTNPMVCQLTSAQLKALNYGLVTTAKEMEMTFGEMIVGDDEPDRSHLDALVIKEKLDHMLKAAMEGIDPETAARDSMIKNVMECRNGVTRTFMQVHINKAPRKCFHCQTTKQNLSLEYETRLIIGAASKKIVSVVKKPGKKAFDFDEFGGMEIVENEPEVFEEENLIFKQVYLTPKEARDHLQKVFENERDIMIQLFSGLCGKRGQGNVSPVDGLFLDVLPVEPSRFRPLARMGEEKFENPRSTILNKIIQDCVVINHLLFALKSGNEEFSEGLKALLSKLAGQTTAEKLQTAWFNLQSHVNAVYDGSLDKLNKDKQSGVKQTLERKSGLFRMHMMGKRVNYAARSVISPDPYIDVDEIGVPDVFAKKLTYPQPVTPWNIKEIRQAVSNGPYEYPGATHVINEDGKKIFLKMAKVQREAIAKQLLKPCLNSKFVGKCKVVLRHLRNGDILLLNRQPSLHKPSIMAHKARILPGEKTFRLNYSNCKSYNADFDGDEMNAHFPQSEVARAEAYCIANVANQYLIPKDGTPLGGLIQDHIIGATLLMMRGMFFNREDYQHLVFGALTRKDDRIRLLPPTIWKPTARWSGKQVVSTVIINTIPTGKHLLSLEGKSKIPLKCWQTQPARPWSAGGSLLHGHQMTESEVVIRQGELLCGILDKAHVGPTSYSMIHCCYELYGGDVSGKLLSQLARLFTHFLQISGFTLGVEDILVIPKADRKRRRIMEHARSMGDFVACEALGLLKDSTDQVALKAKMAEAHSGQDDRPMKELDLCMKLKTDAVNNDINKICMPDGLLKQFPDNHLQLMVLSGAKGATVNCMQISCLLGQIELEGRRPPLMMSGSSLPSFQPYDTSPRAGGFVDGRFLSGIRPQEYFFHCMAGREGLIDTAVKTSRSGYLQRCLIKHMEGLVVDYDLSVRDRDGSLIQFQYGEDALDIPKLPFLKEEQFPFLMDNANVIEDKLAMARLLQNSDYKEVLKKSKKIRRWLGKNGNTTARNRLTGFLKFAEFNLPELKQKHPGVNPATHRENATEKIIEMWKTMDETEKKLYNDQLPKALDPISSLFRPDTTLGAISEKLDHRIETYLAKRPAGMKMSPRNFRKMMHHKIMLSICEPGEAVGLLAAQSIGEPSTQMTLNTFHFAGRGEMNVTLGIPRLVEILKTASDNIATPTLEIPFLPLSKLEKKANGLRKKLSRVYLSEVVESFSIREEPIFQKMKKCRIYNLRFNFSPYKLYKKHLHATPAKILNFMEKVFFKHLIHMIKVKIRIMEQSTLVSNITVRETGGPMADIDDDKEKTSTPKEDAKDAESSDDDNEEEQDATSTKNRARHNQEREYEEEDEENRIQEEGMECGNEDKDNDDENSCSMTPVLDDAETKPTLESEEKEIFADCYDFDSGKMDVDTSNRVANVVDSNPWISNYKFDTECNEWCELTLSLDMLLKKFDMNVILKEEIRKAVINQTPKIKKAFIVKQKNSDGKTETVLKTDGVNITEMFKYDHLLDLRRVYCNDIHAVAHTYGIEVAARVIVKEIQNVFRVYGIEVDPRHLLLIADYMTYHGSYKPFSRLGLMSSASSLQQMSFETTMEFMKQAIISGLPDKLESPSARLVLGRPVGGGTGSFKVFTTNLKG